MAVAHMPKHCTGSAEAEALWRVPSHSPKELHKVGGFRKTQGEFAGKHVAFYDLFRVQNGKIAEHWDTIEAIPAKADWKNTNGKFNF